MTALNKLRNRRNGILGEKQMHRSAVMIPFLVHEGEQCVLLEERAHHLHRQPGEIGFPGGAIEISDEDELAAALRETCEELGLERDEIEIIAPFDTMVAPFGILIHTFIGRIVRPERITPDPQEVASLLYVPLRYLLESKPLCSFLSVQLVPEKGFPFRLIPNGENYNWKSGYYPEYFYFWNDHVIWGITARIIYYLIESLKADN